MGLFDLFRSSASLTIADCLNRTITSVSNFPATLNGKTADGATTPLCRISKSKGEYYIDSLNPKSLPLIDGEPIDQRNKITRDRLYALSLRGHLLVISISSNQLDLGKDFNAHEWSVEAVSGDRLRLQLRPEELNQTALLNRFSPTSHYVVLPGSVEVRFLLKELINLLPKGGASTRLQIHILPLVTGRTRLRKRQKMDNRPVLFAGRRSSKGTFSILPPTMTLRETPNSDLMPNSALSPIDSTNWVKHWTNAEWLA